jgi:hypothetical protein
MIYFWRNPQKIQQNIQSSELRVSRPFDSADAGLQQYPASQRLKLNSNSGSLSSSLVKLRLLTESSAESRVTFLPVSSVNV